MMVRALTATGVQACLVLMLATLLVSGCGDHSPTGPKGGTATGLVIIRADGSTIQFPPDARVYLWCGPWEEGSVDTLTIHVWYGTCGTGMPAAGWWLRAVHADIVLGDTLWFPNSFVWDQPHGADLFLWDPPNELSTSQPESAGYMIFHALPCGHGDVVEFSIDAVLGSEYHDLRPVTVRGRFRARTTGAPPCFD